MKFISCSSRFFTFLFCCLALSGALHTRLVEAQDSASGTATAGWIQTQWWNNHNTAVAPDYTPTPYLTSLPPSWGFIDRTRIPSPTPCVGEFCPTETPIPYITSTPDGYAYQCPPDLPPMADVNPAYALQCSHCWPTPTAQYDTVLPTAVWVRPGSFLDAIATELPPLPTDHPSMTPPPTCAPPPTLHPVWCRAWYFADGPVYYPLSLGRGVYNAGSYLGQSQLHYWTVGFSWSVPAGTTVTEMAMEYYLSNHTPDAFMYFDGNSGNIDYGARARGWVSRTGVATSNVHWYVASQLNGGQRIYSLRLRGTGVPPAGGVDCNPPDPTPACVQETPNYTPVPSATPRLPGAASFNRVTTFSCMDIDRAGVTPNLIAEFPTHLTATSYQCNIMLPQIGPWGPWDLLFAKVPQLHIPPVEVCVTYVQIPEISIFGIPFFSMVIAFMGAMGIYDLISRMSG